MFNTSYERLESEDGLLGLMPGEAGKAQGVLVWSSLFFVVLQSVCTFFTALDGLRVVIGVGALASVTEAGMTWDKFHADWIRVPMIAFALGGSLLNLVALVRVRRLRDRPAAQWRRVAVTPRKLRMEGVQFGLSLLTLALVAIEEVTHFHTFHRF